MKTRLPSLAATSALAVGLLAAASPPVSSDQFITLTSSKVRLEQLKTSHEVESDWNCVCVDIAANPIALIVPNDQSGDPDRLEDVLAHYDDIGGHRSSGHYPWGWALAGNTPFRRWKR